MGYYQLSMLKLFSFLFVLCCRENVAIILLLRAKQETVFKECENKYLCVATTHVNIKKMNFLEKKA